MNQDIKLTTVKPVCEKDCPDRNWDCHGKCEKYKAFRAECDIALKKRFQEKEGERDVNKAINKAIKRLAGQRRI